MQSSVLIFSLLRSDPTFSLGLKINKSFTSRDTVRFSHPLPAPLWLSLPSEFSVPSINPSIPPSCSAPSHRGQKFIPKALCLSLPG